MNKLENFLQNNKGGVPKAPTNEWTNILNRIENSKSFWELLKESLTSRPFWLSAGLSTACALVIVVKLSAPVIEDQFDYTLSQVSDLYSEDLQLQDSEFLE